MLLKKLAIVLTVAFSVPAFAATQTWNVNTSTNGNSNGNTVTANSGGLGLTVKAWSDTGGGSDNVIRSARLVKYGSGLGAINRDEAANNQTSAPQHSIDSKDYSGSDGQDYEFVSLNFTEAVNLSHIDIGWATDSGGSINQRFGDMSFAALTGNVLNGNTWQNIVTNSTIWTNSIADVSTSGYQAIGSASIYSKVWLVGAYSSVFKSLGYTGYRNDGVKLAGLKTSTREGGGGEVPAPGSLLLLLIGLLALYTYRNSSWGGSIRA